MQKVQGTGPPGSPQPLPSTLSSPQLHAATIPNSNAGYTYNVPSAMGVSTPYSTAAQILHPQAHAAMHHSVMRHPSPGPHQAHQQALNAHGNYGPLAYWRIPVILVASEMRDDDSEHAPAYLHISTTTRLLVFVLYLFFLSVCHIFYSRSNLLYALYFLPRCFFSIRSYAR